MAARFINNEFRNDGRPRRAAPTVAPSVLKSLFDVKAITSSDAVFSTIGLNLEKLDRVVASAQQRRGNQNYDRLVLPFVDLHIPDSPVTINQPGAKVLGVSRIFRDGKIYLETSLRPLHAKRRRAFCTS